MRNTIRLKTACLMLFILAAFAGTANANRIKLSGTYGPGQIKKACDNAGGDFSNGGAHGYTCVGSGGTVDCNSNGKCTGDCSKCGARQVQGKGLTGILHAPAAVNVSAHGFNQTNGTTAHEQARVKSIGDRPDQERSAGRHSGRH